MFIQTELTPNPETVKFIPDAPYLPAGTAPLAFQASDDTTAAPLAAALLVDGRVAAVMIAPDYVAVTKHTDQTWEDLRTSVLVTLMDFAARGEPAVLLAADAGSGAGAVDLATYNAHDRAIVDTVLDLLETRVRPAVAADGGDITFVRYHDGVVTVAMRGACAGCPSSTATLKSGIENMIKHYVPDVRAVEAA
jgi:Fe-S cluster biogenesis protein NfuA